MGNSCKGQKKDKSSKKHFEDKKKKVDKINIEKDKETKEKNTEINIGEKKEEDIKIEEKKEEIKKEEKKEKKKDFKVKQEKENTSLDVNNFSEEAFTCNLRIEIILKNISNDNEYIVELNEYENSRKTSKKKIGQTETKKASPDKNIKFENGIVIPFHFSQIQPLEFLIKNGKATITIEKSLGEIIGSLNQTYRETIEGDVIFEAKVFLHDELDKQCVFNIEVSGSLVGMRIGYTITNLGNQYDPINKLVYESEILENNSLIKFNSISIPLNELASDENLEDNIIEISFKDVQHSTELGKYSSNLAQFFEKENIIEFKGDKKAKVVSIKKNFYSLLDYLEKEFHLTTSLFIDFSEIDKANTHHEVNNEIVFEKLMQNFIDVLVSYNEDDFFHIYGFGFELKDKNVNYDPNMYPINKKVGAPSVKRNEIKKFYTEFLSSIDFGNKKTNLDLIIKNINTTIKEGIENYGISEYNVLLLFANNDIIDEKEFFNDLIISSALPISIVVIGLGNGPYTKLEDLENNFLNLKNDDGNKPQRKCLKFVSFKKNSKNFQRTVQKALIDIPNEMVEYLSINNIIPGM